MSKTILSKLLLFTALIFASTCLHAKDENGTPIKSLEKFEKDLAACLQTNNIKNHCVRDLISNHYIQADPKRPTPEAVQADIEAALKDYVVYQTHLVIDKRYLPTLGKKKKKDEKDSFITYQVYLIEDIGIRLVQFHVVFRRLKGDLYIYDYGFTTDMEEIKETLRENA